MEDILRAIAHPCETHQKTYKSHYQG